MNILFMIIKEVKQNIRDKKSMTMMILFPIVLIIVLGAAFKSSFSNSSTIGKAQVAYKIENSSDAAKNLEQAITSKTFSNISFSQTEDIEQAKKDLSMNKLDAVMEMKEDNKIQIYENDKNNFKAGLVESTLNIYAQRYNTIVSIAKVNPAVLNTIMTDTSTDFTQITSLNKANQPSSLDYYAVTMLTLIIMYGANIGLYGVAGEKQNKTRDRILSGPIRKYEFLTGKTLGCVVVTILQILVVILFSKYALNANWGNDIFTIMLVVTSQIIMSVSLGVGLGFIFKQANVAGGLLNFIIPIIVFLGGGYLSVDNIGGKTFEMITYLSPVRWVNKSIFEVIYNSNYDKVLPTIMINIGLAALFLTISSLIFRKESV